LQTSGPVTIDISCHFDKAVRTVSGRAVNEPILRSWRQLSGFPRHFQHTSAHTRLRGVVAMRSV